jgi:monoamine oxidase
MRARRIPRRDEPADSPAAGKQVAIVGAGLAGLTAAWRLAAAGATVRVFEARYRLGGRVHTVRDLSGGQHGELGGDLIEEGQSAVFELADALGLELDRVLRAGFGFALHAGRRRPRFVDTQAPLWEGLEALFSPELASLTVLRGHEGSPAARRLAARSLAAALQDRGATGDLRAMATALRGFFLADAEDLSLLPVLEQAANGAPGARLFRVRGGNDRLARELAARLPQPIVFGQAAVSVTVNGASGPRLGLLAEDGGLTQVACDFLVLAIPATTLSAVAFDPPLPERQGTAIQHLRYGPATKALVQFARPFWRRRGRPRALATDVEFGALWDAGEGQRCRLGLLTLLGGGGASAPLADWLRGAGEGVGRDLAWLGPPAPALGTHLVQWEHDPWARGGYAYMAAGDDPGLRDWLARPYQGVVFAGEHTSLLGQGYMAGAIESGHRAAIEVEALASGLASLSG